tara:strand:+ start:527 stop:883 length:357 start_codon:yes stop_codon:yes gene_type:complete
MRRFVTTAGVTLVAILAFGLYKLKYEVQDLEARYAQVNRTIVAEQEAIRVLNAEWSFLNNPKRLGNLSKHHLKVRPVGADRFVCLDDIPFRRPGSDEHGQRDKDRLVPRFTPPGGRRC